MRTTFAFALLGIAWNQASAPEPPPRDWSAAYPALLDKVPADAYVVAVADVGHSLERLSALRRVVLTMPTAKRYLEPKLAELKTRIGWDPLETKDWQAQGLSAGSPFAFVMNAD